MPHDSFAPPTFRAEIRKALVGRNLSGTALGSSFLLRDLPGSFAVPNQELVADQPESGEVEVAQRELDYAKAEEIARYVVRAAVARAYKIHSSDGALQQLVDVLFGGHEYIPHFFALPALEAGAFKGDVENWTKNKVHESATEVIFDFSLPRGGRLYLVDGQHRWKGICLAMEFFDREVAQGRISGKGIFREYGGIIEKPLSQLEAHAWQLVERVLFEMTVTVQIHVEMERWDQFRQAFAVMNLNQKKASTSLGYTWDLNNPVSAWLKGEMPQLFGGVEKKLETSASDSAKIRFDDDGGRMSLRDVMGITSILTNGTLSPKRVTPSQVQRAAPTVTKFWRKVIEAGVFSPGSKEASVLAQPAVLKGIATLIHQLRKKHGKNPEGYKLMLDSVLEILHPDHSLWQHRPDGDTSIWERLDQGYQDPSRQDAMPNKNGQDVWGVVSSTITLGDATQKFGTRVYRFGAKTNDIRRVVADVIRWERGLPARRSRKSLAKAA